MAAKAPGANFDLSTYALPPLAQGADPEAHQIFHSQKLAEKYGEHLFEKLKNLLFADPEVSAFFQNEEEIHDYLENMSSLTMTLRRTSQVGMDRYLNEKITPLGLEIFKLRNDPVEKRKKEVLKLAIQQLQTDVNRMIATKIDDDQTPIELCKRRILIDQCSRILRIKDTIVSCQKVIAKNRPAQAFDNTLQLIGLGETLLGQVYEAKNSMTKETSKERNPVRVYRKLNDVDLLYQYDANCFLLNCAKLI